MRRNCNDMMPEYPGREGFEEKTHRCAECNCELEHIGAGDGEQGPLACPDCAARDADLEAECDKAEKLHKMRFRLERLGYRLVALDANHYAALGRGLPEHRLYWSPSERDGGAWVLVPVERANNG